MNLYSEDELLALGFTQVGRDTRVSRRAVFYDISGTLGDGARIDDFAILTGNVSLGDRTHVSPFCFLGGTGGRIVMEAGAGLSTHVSIFTKSDDYQEIATGPRSKVTGDVTIGAYSILGAQCVVLPGTTIGSHCSIGIGCVLTDNIPDRSRYVSVGIKSARLS